MGELLEIFKKLDINLDTKYASICSYKYGIGIWHDCGLKELTDYPQSIIVFKKGYYDE